jgi:hypothetical protein
MTWEAAKFPCLRHRWLLAAGVEIQVVFQK